MEAFLPSGRPSRYVLGPDERPDWLRYPNAYLQLVDQLEVELTPWVMLRASETLALRRGLFERYRDRDLVPFARRSDCDDVACWDRSRPREVVLVHDFASPGWEGEGTVGTFRSWFFSALEDMCAWDDASELEPELDLPRHRRWLIAGLDDPLMGRVHCALGPRGDGEATACAHRVAEQYLRVRVNAASLREISRADAAAIAGTIYARARRSSLHAEALAEQFVDALGCDARFFSTWMFETRSHRRQEWCATGRPILGGSFDLGFVAVSTTGSGVLWVADED